MQYSQNTSQDPGGLFLIIPFQVNDLNNGKDQQKATIHWFTPEDV